jgi:hypothetical protein
VLCCELQDIRVRRAAVSAATTEPPQPTCSFDQQWWAEVLRRARTHALSAKAQAALEACRKDAATRDQQQRLSDAADRQLQRVVKRYLRAARVAAARLVREGRPGHATGETRRAPPATPGCAAAPANCRAQALDGTWQTILSGPLEKALTEGLRKVCFAQARPSSWQAVCAELENDFLKETYLYAMRLEALEMGLVGLAFSGGGIRSATFNLGILQALADARLLKLFDYLSTVSGGGYIGGWFAAWVKRAGSLARVEEQLRPGRDSQAEGRSEPPFLPADGEPEPIYHLRSYSSYLTPRRGLFSADSWVLAATYMRNVLLNQLILLPLVLALLLAPRFILPLYALYEPGLDIPVYLTSIALLGFALVSIGVSLNRMSKVRHRRYSFKVPIQTRTIRLHLFIIIPLLLFAILMPWELSYDFWYNNSADVFNWLPAQRSGLAHFLEGHLPLGVEWLRAKDSDGATQAWVTSRYSDESAPPLLVASTVGLLGSPLKEGPLLATCALPPAPQPGAGHHLAWIVVLGTWFGLLALGIHVILGIVFGWWRAFTVFLLKALFVFLSGFAAIALYYVVFGIALEEVYPQDWSNAFLATAGPPLVFLLIALAMFFAVGLFGKNLTEDVREWWASLCGHLFVYAVVWGSVVGIALFGPPLLVAASEWGQAALGSAWVAIAVAGVLAGRRSQTQGGRGNRVLERVALIAPHVFLGGLFLLLSLVAAASFRNLPNPEDPSFAAYYRKLNDVRCLGIAWRMGICVAVALFMAWRVDVNLFSLHGMYANRLVRCYLGASRRKDRDLAIRDVPGGTPVPSSGPIRSPNAITGFDPEDDLELRRLRIGAAQATAGAGEPQDTPYLGPLLLINTAMNLVGGDELAWQERKAESFVLTPWYCGSQSTGFQLLPDSGDKALLLGSAMTLSGAAVTPNMGYHSSPPVTAFLTVFNVRLGGWVANPSFDVPRNTGPRMGLLCLRNELFGWTNSRSSYVYLSDGGHFDNLGVYELIRRRCRYILACDAGADPSASFEDLGNLIRKCRTDFGVRIKIDVTPLQRPGGGSFSRWHCAIGKVLYHDVDAGAEEGVLVYIKASLTGDEPADVIQFQAQHPQFPHHSTVDQFFNETKFESYRALGYHIAQQVLRKAKPVDHASDEPVAALGERVFKQLAHAWYPPPPHVDESFLRSMDDYLDLQKILQADSNLRELSREIYGPLDQGLQNAGDKSIAQLHVVSHMLQVMEAVWIRLRLEDHQNYPLYKGWMQVFCRWIQSETFRRYWHILKDEFSDSFVEGIEQLMRQQRK